MKVLPVSYFAHGMCKWKKGKTIETEFYKADVCSFV